MLNLANDMSSLLDPSCRDQLLAIADHCAKVDSTGRAKDIVDASRTLKHARKRAAKRHPIKSKATDVEVALGLKKFSGTVRGVAGAQKRNASIGGITFKP